MDTISAAEAHGVIAGELCGPRPNDEASAKAILADVDPAIDTSLAQDLLTALRAETALRLAGRESEFSPLLPDDGRDLLQRVSALADFCRGYLLGLAAGGMTDLAHLPGDAREVVEDFTKIAEAEADSAADEVEEQALAELTEYVRLGVQIVYEELHGTD